MQLPGMLHAKIFRSTVAHGRIKSVDVSEARKMPGVYVRLSPATISAKSSPNPYYGPAFHDQPILASARCTMSASRWRWRSPSIPRRRQAAQEIVADYEELPAVFDEVEAAENKTLVHEQLKPAGTFADLKHLKGRKGTNIALDFRLAAATSTRRSKKPRRCSNTRSAPRKCCIWRWSPTRRSPIIAMTASPLFRAPRDRLSCAPRSRGCSAGRKIACASRCLSRRRLRRQALHQDGSARGRVVDAGAPAGQGRADDGRAILHHHQAPEHVPHQERPRQATARSSRANARSGGTAAPMPISARG